MIATNEQTAQAVETPLRSLVYGFFRRIFTCELDAAMLAWCRQQDRNGLWDDLGVDLHHTLHRRDGGRVLEELAVDFCRLFLTSGASGIPCESLHVNRDDGETKLLCGDPLSEVKMLYREAGFEIHEDTHQIPDALGVELEFMERLCMDEAQAVKDGRTHDAKRLCDMQARMLDDHLLQWFPAYARRVRDAADTDFYRAMLALAADFLEMDAVEMKK